MNCVKGRGGVPLMEAMTDRGALVVAREEAAGADASRWRRRGARPPWRPRPWTAIGVVAFALISSSVWSHAGQTGFAARLGAGCEELADCVRLEAEAERRAQACWLACGQESTAHELARVLRYRAEERRAVREHYRQRDAAERNTEQALRRERAEERERERLAREQASEREHRHALELERLRQDRIDRRIARERDRRVSYLRLLGPEARKERARRCHAKRGACEQLLLDLVEASASAAETRELVELEQRLSASDERAPKAVSELSAVPSQP